MKAFDGEMPEPSLGEIQTAQSVNAHIARVFCKNAHTMVAFNAICSFIPRIGEEIESADGIKCVVTHVGYKCVSMRAMRDSPSITALVPHVYAEEVVVDTQEEDESFDHD